MNESLKLCLNSIKNSTFNDYEIILVDDCSKQNPFEFTKCYGCKELRLTKRSGPGAARNRGAAIAEGEILLFIDADVEVKRDTIEKAAAFLDNNPGIAAVVGDYTRAPGKHNFVSIYKNLFHTYYHTHSKTETSTFFTACSAIRKKVFWEISGFEEKLGPAVEDIELGYKIRAAGHKIQLEPAIKVCHNKRFTIKSLILTDLFGRGIPWVKIIYKYKFYSNDLNTDTKSIASTFISYLLIFSFLMGIFESSFLCAFALSGVLLLGINLPFICYMYQNRGLIFCIKSFFMLLIYYLCCGLSAFFGTISYLYENKINTRKKRT